MFLSGAWQCRGTLSWFHLSPPFPDETFRQVTWAFLWTQGRQEVSAHTGSQASVKITCGGADSLSQLQVHWGNERANVDFKIFMFYIFLIS